MGDRITEWRAKKAVEINTHVTEWRVKKAVESPAPQEAPIRRYYASSGSGAAVCGPIRRVWLDGGRVIVEPPPEGRADAELAGEMVADPAVYVDIDEHRGGHGMTRVKANRGGHAPGHLRRAFEDWVDAGATSKTLRIDDTPRPWSWLSGQLWSCSDVLPSAACADLDMPHGSTYAQAVRRLRSRER